MTPTEINIAIAKACGWTFITPTMLGGIPPCGRPSDARSIPNYYGSLDAMAEAVKVLTERQKEVFANILDQIEGINGRQEEIYIPDAEDYIQYIEMPALSSFGYVNATAPQRAESFLRTLGLWVEDVQTEEKDSTLIKPY